MYTVTPIIIIILTMTFIIAITHYHNVIFHEAFNKNTIGTYMNMNTDKVIMLCQ